ncbi:UV-endonuclease UvdE [Pluteus cervinus]|uniref:UV-endonuclease UvdE n=1 Tax=Pluteus cervinus TaxID=181527 RepID=A0ACD3ANW2_9AGAR|nr:UV-endonuclease UvdE [Pluteus cervinus]
MSGTNIRRSVRLLIMSSTTEVVQGSSGNSMLQVPSRDQRGSRKRTRKAAELEATSAEVDVNVVQDATPDDDTSARKSKRRRGTRKRRGNVQVEDALEGVAHDEETQDDSVTMSAGKGDRSQSKKRKRKQVVDEDAFVDIEEKKPRKKRAPKPEPVSIIPEVESKETTFKGRLGYACLNTVLRNKRPASDSIFCSRTCRLDSLEKNGLDWVKDLGRKNVEDLITMIQWNEDNHIKFLRVSSEMFPFASHKIHGYTLEFCDDLLAKAGALAHTYGHRLTTHPGQYTQLGSPRAEVIDAAVRELDYHCEMLDRMGVGIDGVMIVHGGGVYGDKSAALERIKETITSVLPSKVRNRLVLENDELCYTAEDLLPLCEELAIPLVFDYHHDIINPSSIPPSEIIRRANLVWARRGIRPKQHLSEPRPGAVTVMERRAHADRCESLPADLPDDMDLMIEAKDKEQAVLHLYRIYGLQPVNHGSLRPPNPNQTKETKGRKSNKRARAKLDKVAVEECAEERSEEVLYGEDAEEHEKVPE